VAGSKFTQRASHDSVVGSGHCALVQPVCVAFGSQTAVDGHPQVTSEPGGTEVTGTEEEPVELPST